MKQFKLCQQSFTKRHLNKGPERDMTREPDDLTKIYKSVP